MVLVPGRSLSWKVSVGLGGVICANATASSSLHHAMVLSKSRFMASMLSSILLQFRSSHVSAFISMVDSCLQGERTSEGLQRRQRQPCYQWCTSALSSHSEGP